MSNKYHQRFEYLDGIRGVAALIVVLSHFRNAFFDALNTSTTYTFLWGRLNYFFLTGGFCVELFFVLSGFVLAYNSFNRPQFLTKQWSKRLYRLFVPVFITSIVYFIFSNNNLFYFEELCKIHCSDWTSSHWVIKYTVVQFIQRCVYDFMLFSDWQFVMNINSSLWTIPIELYWSYVLFVLFFIVNKLTKMIWKNIAIIIYTLSVLSFMSFKGIEYVVLFIGGTLLALNYKFIFNTYNTKMVNLIFIIIICVLTYIVEFKWLNQVEFTFFCYKSILALLYLGIALRSSFIQKLFSFSIITWLGKISFSLYLIHILIIGSISSKLYILLPYLRHDFGLLVLLFSTLLFSFSFAHIFTLCIDEPAMKLFDKYYTKMVNIVSFRKL